jgi:hypothetical protein
MGGPGNTGSMQPARPTSKKAIPITIRTISSTMVFYFAEKYKKCFVFMPGNI